MDSSFKIGKNFFFIFKTIFILSCLTSTLCQLTETDMNHMKKTLLSLQEETSGLFSKSVESTYRAISSLKILNLPVTHISKICKEIGYESMNHLSFEIIQINELLNCKNNFEIPKELRDEEMMNVDLDILYKRVMLATWANAKVNWELLFENVKPFITSEKFFSNENSSQHYSLLSTAYGLKLLATIHDKVDKNTKMFVKAELVLVVSSLQKEFQLIREDIGLFTENQVNSFLLNSEVIQALTTANAIINIENVEDTLIKILNYFVTFKYEYSKLENIFYLLQGLQTLSYLPIASIDNKFFDPSEDKFFTLRLVNGFGKELNEYKTTFHYSLMEIKEEKQQTNKGEYDLEDEPEETKKYEGEATSNTSTVKLDLSNFVTNSGQFDFDVKASYTNSQTLTFTNNFKFNLISTSKVKLNHLKFSVTNTKEKQDEKEVTVDYPKRIYKNFQASQNSIIKLKVKLNYGNNQVNKIEQIFLRLRNTEIGKSFSGYVSEYKNLDDYHYINFDISDPTHMEAYDGLYELTLIVSDASFENPMIWNFGKIEIKFKKPLDPSGLSPSYKNAQKNKMEPSFPQEESPNKNLTTSILICSILFGILFYYLIYLKNNKANMENFPKGTDGIFSVGFVIFLLLSTYLMILFFVKLNIIQTLVTFIVISVPGTIIIYKALTGISIEV